METEHNKEKVPVFTCGTKDTCQFKQHYVNNRCFAAYPIRQSCPSVIRADGKTWKQGSDEEMVRSR